MAKSSKPVGVVAEIIPARVVESARKLLSRAEKQFFDSSFGAALAKHTHAQVEAATKQARILRNKWRDLHQAQSRSAKRSGRATEAANARTREKHDILAGVVARFEKRIAELQEAVAHATGAKQAKPRPKTAPKIKPPTTPQTNSKTKATRVAKPVAAKSKKASRRVTAGLADAPAGQLVRFDRSAQRSAFTAAKASRIKRGGQGTQRLGHAAASGRRAQRRRDIRSRG